MAGLIVQLFSVQIVIIKLQPPPPTHSIPLQTTTTYYLFVEISECGWLAHYFNVHFETLSLKYLEVMFFRGRGEEKVELGSAECSGAGSPLRKCLCNPEEANAVAVRLPRGVVRMREGVVGL